MRRLIAVSFLVCTSLAPVAPRLDAQEHDCRISSVGSTLAVRRSGSHVLRIVYRGVDGQPLSPFRCPDQIPPTIGIDHSEGASLDLEQADVMGYLFNIEVIPAGVVTVTVTAAQNSLDPAGGWRLIYGTNRYRVR